MAKKKTKSKMSLNKLIISIIVLTLSVLTICTLFMPMFKSFVDSALLGTSSEVGSISGSDVFASAFHGETNADLTAGANTLIALKGGDNAFVTIMLSWGYVLTIALAIVAIVFTVLYLLNLKFKLLNTVFGALFVLLSIITFIFAIVVAGKIVNFGFGSIVSAKTIISIATYFLFAGLIAGGLQVYNARK